MELLRYRFGLDLGGTKLGVGIVNDEGHLVSKAITGQQLAAGILEANEVCVSVAKTFGTSIGIGVHHVFQTLNPDRVALGGGLLNLPPVFFDTIISVCSSKAGAMMYDRLEMLVNQAALNITMWTALEKALS